MGTKNDGKRSAIRRKQVLEFEDFLIFHESGIPLYYHVHHDEDLPLNDPVLKGGFLSAMMQFARPYTVEPNVLYDFGFGDRHVFLMYLHPYYFALTLRKIHSSTKYETMERNVRRILDQVKHAFRELMNESRTNILSDDKELERFKMLFEEKFKTILRLMGFSATSYSDRRVNFSN